MRLLVLSLLVTACSAGVRGIVVVGPDPLVTPTPNGTTILRWNLKQSDRVSIRTGMPFETQRTSTTYVAHPTAGSSVTVAVELAYGRVTFSESGEWVTHTAPVELEVRVLDNGSYKFERVRCMGPHYPLTAPGDAPEEMLLHCWFRVSTPNKDVGFTLYARGTGTIDDGRPRSHSVRLSAR